MTNQLTPKRGWFGDGYHIEGLTAWSKRSLYVGNFRKFSKMEGFKIDKSQFSVIMCILFIGKLE